MALMDFTFKIWNLLCELTFFVLVNFQIKFHPHITESGVYFEKFVDGIYFEKDLYYIMLSSGLQEDNIMGKHLTLDERINIASLLNKQESFKSIGTFLGKDCTTVSKEVRNHRIFKQTGAPGRSFNACRLRYVCDKRHLCKVCIRSGSRVYCWSCQLCNKHCPDFIEERCPSLDRAPYVCNGCTKLKTCSLTKCFYQPGYAHKEYLETLSQTRQGLSLSEQEIKHLDSIISPLIRKGQSIHHICATNKDSIMVSESTIYRLIGYNVFTARNIDLPRKVRYSSRKVRKHVKVDTACRIGRSYQDYLSYMAQNPNLPVVEMDSVEGCKGGKVLLTLHFVKAEFMIAFLRDANDSQSVIDVFERLYLELRPDIFLKVLPVLLTDNGSEFSNPNAIEFDRQGNQRAHVFYCDPSAPEQKGSAERNHELIRYCIPKGTSLDGYTQEMISCMMDNINSLTRKSLGDKCPYDALTFLYGQKLPCLLGCRKIPANDVTLTPAVFDKFLRKVGDIQ